MTVMTAEEYGLVSGISRLAYCNPFTPERVACERELLGREYLEAGRVWSIRTRSHAENPNLVRVDRLTVELADRLRDRMATGRPTADERRVYEDLVIYLVFNRYRPQFTEISRRLTEAKPVSAYWTGPYEAYRADLDHYLCGAGLSDCETCREPEHLFACLFQVRRAFDHIFNYIAGESMPAGRLRAAVWESIFTHDIGRYRRSLYRRLGDVTTLITGPSGTGKELVARAIGFSRYLPFDAQKMVFPGEPDAFHALNLSALSPTLIESELFGHRRGAFTGAIEDRRGWLDVCGPLGTVFLDEIGDLAPVLQVKLLRVLQTRRFERLGDTATREFTGKVIAATNRDLAQGIREGWFRRDLYYRLCADLVVTPSLREQLADSPEDLPNIVHFVACRVVGEEEAAALSREVVAWIERELGLDYAWPGNVRELEQCVRNIMIRREYRPTLAPAATGPGAALAAALEAGKLTADELVNRYCRMVYEQTHSYAETARRLGLDRRTVKARVAAPQ